jgi:hypothetical protein
MASVSSLSLITKLYAASVTDYPVIVRGGAGLREKGINERKQTPLGMRDPKSSNQPL